MRVSIRILFVTLLLRLIAFTRAFAADSVVIGSNEWIQPVNFLGYTYDQIATICPPSSGKCSGSLPGSNYDLTGYSWASETEMASLYCEFGAKPPYSVNDLDPLGSLVKDSDFFTYFEPENQNRGNSSLWGTLRDSRYKLAYVYGLFNDIYFAIDDNPGFDPERTGAWFWRSADGGDGFSTKCPSIVVSLEEPINRDVHSGIGNLRGWAIAEDGIDRVEIYIDGKYAYNAPYGGSRGDVKKAHPEAADSVHSGFSLSFGYSHLGFGQHTIMARAFNKSGEWADASSTFDVVTFDKKFIDEGDVVDASEAQVTTTDDEISIENIQIGDRLYDLRLKWRTQEQGFEIFEIR